MSSRFACSSVSKVALVGAVVPVVASGIVTERGSHSEGLGLALH
ncbi:hypothetical protein [Rhodococcus erythropolis]|nr:hypothetical protein [Rhodococcus erythropolis]